MGTRQRKANKILLTIHHQRSSWGTRPLKANEILLTTHFQANELPGAARSNLLFQFGSEGPASQVAVEEGCADESAALCFL